MPACQQGDWSRTQIVEFVRLVLSAVVQPCVRSVANGKGIFCSDNEPDNSVGYRVLLSVTGKR